jgi:ubiquitin C-terminal hydrolase
MNVNNKNSTRIQEPENEEDMMSQQSMRRKSQRKGKQLELREGVVGLKNNSLYCYMNATLQCMACVDDLRDYILE